MLRGIKCQELRRLARAALAQGWQVTRTGSDHVRWRAPAGGLCFSGSSPSDKGGTRNHRARLKRMGLRLP